MKQKSIVVCNAKTISTIVHESPFPMVKTSVEFHVRKVLFVPPPKKKWIACGATKFIKNTSVDGSKISQHGTSPLIHSTGPVPLFTLALATVVRE